jgi:hypothetical protein
MAPVTEFASPSASLAMGAHARGCDTANAPLPTSFMVKWPVLGSRVTCRRATRRRALRRNARSDSASATTSPPPKKRNTRATNAPDDETSDDSVRAVVLVSSRSKLSSSSPPPCRLRCCFTTAPRRMLSRIAEWRIVALPALSSSSSASPAIVVGTSSSDLPSRSAPEGTRSSFVSRTEELSSFHGSPACAS